MKLYAVLFSLLIMLIISCTKNTGVIVTNPDSNLVLDKIRYGNFKGVSLNGNTLTITGSQNNNNGTYQFYDYFLSLVSMFKDGNGNTLLVVPLDGKVNIVKVKQEGLELLQLLMNSDNPEYKKVFGNLLQQAMQNDGKIDTAKTDEIFKDVNLSETERNKLEDLLAKSSDDFINYESII
ncbi:hypothetical protein [Brachyspira hampsonii]|uniref:hypothetical protein n=1 Tax=Brachyspira hampsonii TaxID=1287055 RepID=UPI000D3B819E|nr:hypothetical protein [Brachyspira hampsonii]PTY41302.1 hypothetical protein DQ06_12595 [Brachyspira hampsonii bv. II]